MIWLFLSALLGAVNAMDGHQCEYFSMFHTNWGQHLLQYADCQDILDGEIATPRMEPTKTKFCECVRHDKRLVEHRGKELNCHLYTGSSWEDDTLASTTRHECKNFRGGEIVPSTRDIKMYDVSRYTDDASQTLQENDKGTMEMTVRSDTLELGDTNMAAVIFRQIDLIPGEDMVTAAFLGLAMSTALPVIPVEPCQNTTGNCTDKTPAPVMKYDLEIVVSLESSTNPQGFDRADIFSRKLHGTAMTTFNTDGKGMVFVDVLPQLLAAFDMSSWDSGRGVSLILDRKVGHGTVMVDAFESGNGPLLVVESKRAPTPMPTKSPTKSPTYAPTYQPTSQPSKPPTRAPTPAPTKRPTAPPTKMPTQSPTPDPTMSPTMNPTMSPTMSPTNSPTMNPTMQPTNSPTPSPSMSPTTGVTDDECGSLDIFPDICDEDPACAYDYTTLKCSEMKCIMVEDDDPKSHTFGQDIYAQDNCGSNRFPGVRQECKAWLKENKIKQVKKNLAACIIQRSETNQAPPCCQAYVCQQSGNCRDTFHPTPEPTQGIAPECMISDACPSAAKSCNRVYREETGTKKSPSEEIRAQCVVDWAKSSPTKKGRNNFWKSKNIGKPWPVFEESKNADCCADFVCHMDPTECYIPPTPKPEPIVCESPPDAGDCLVERRKCKNEFLELGTELVAINTAGELLLSNCVQGFVKRGEASDCCRDYVCSVKGTEGGMMGEKLCDGGVAPTQDPTPSPTAAPVVDYWGFNEWDAYCASSFTKSKDCKANKCRFRKGACGAGRASEKFKCDMFGILCFQFKGCMLEFSATGDAVCGGKLDEEVFFPDGREDESG